VVLSEGDDILERWLGEEVEEVGEEKKRKRIFLIDTLCDATSEFKWEKKYTCTTKLRWQASKSADFALI
jgi:hypothetical protein